MERPGWPTRQNWRAKRLETSEFLRKGLLTFVERFELLLKLCHVLVELDALLLLCVVLGEGLEVDLRHLFVLGVELVQLEDRVRLALRVGRVVPELVRLTVFLNAHFIALFPVAEVEAFTTVDSCTHRQR